MKILLVRPENSPETIGLQHLMVVEPLELEILSALCRPGDQVDLVDMILEKRPFSYYLEKHQPDLLALTGYITNVNTIKRYAATGKKLIPHLKTVVGGVHCEVCPEDFDAPGIDFRVVRNAVQVFPGFLDHLDGMTDLPKGILRSGERLQEQELPAFDFRVPFPDREISRRYRSKYFYIFQHKVALLKTSFGCPFTCAFCFCREITRKAYHARPIPEVLDELELIKEKEIYIFDDDFLISRKRIRAFIQGLKDRNIHKHYLVYSRADFIAQNPEMMQELYEVGLRTVIVGFESFSEEESEKFDKRTSVETNREAMHILNSCGIACFATIIVSPDWGRADFRRMVREVKKLGIHFVNLQPLTPLPKTGFSVAEQDRLLDPAEFEKWDLAHLSIRPTKLSIPDYYREIVKAYRSILFQPQVIWAYLRKQSPRMLFRMIRGSQRVARQYQEKIKQAESYA